jgi:hypothetical protein
MDSGTVLRALNAAAVDGLFADLEHPYSFLIDARQHAYSDTERWVLLIEVVGYNPRAGNVVDVLYPVGNAVLVEPGSPALDLRRIDNIGQLFAEPDDDEAEEEGDDAFTYAVRQVPLVIRGQQVTVDAPHEARTEELFRLLVPEYRERGTCRGWRAGPGCAVAGRRVGDQIPVHDGAVGGQRGQGDVEVTVAQPAYEFAGDRSGHRQGQVGAGAAAGRLLGGCGVAFAGESAAPLLAAWAVCAAGKVEHVEPGPTCRVEMHGPR